MLQEGNDRSKFRILAVDDVETNLLLLRWMLERDGYTNVTTTTDPQRVPGMFLEIRPDLVLLDLHMPVIDGFELMDRLRRSDGDGSDVPFVVLTADATDETRRRALWMGARDLVTKPIDRVELLRRVRDLLHVEQLQDLPREHNVHLADEVEMLERRVRAA